MILMRRVAFAAAVLLSFFGGRYSTSVGAPAVATYYVTTDKFSISFTQKLVCCTHANAATRN